MTQSPQTIFLRSIKEDSPAGVYLSEKQVSKNNFNFMERRGSILIWKEELLLMLAK